MEQIDGWMDTQTDEMGDEHKAAVRSSVAYMSGANSTRFSLFYKTPVMSVESPESVELKCGLGHRRKQMRPYCAC